MTIYLLSYDLIKERSGQDYQPLWDELKRLGAHRTQLSARLIDVNNTAQQLTEHFKQFVDKDDRLWVTRVRPNEHWYVNAIAGTNDWLQRHPPT